MSFSIETFIISGVSIETANFDSDSVVESKKFNINNILIVTTKCTIHLYLC